MTLTAVAQPEAVKKKATKFVTIEYDEDAECPMEWDGQWTLYSFKRNSIHFKDIRTFLDVHDHINIGLRKKLEAGTAFWLDVYEHSGIAYSLHGEGMQDRWDTAPKGGLLIWENPIKELGAKTYEDRAKDAKAFLDTYNAWANGQGLWYSVEKPGKTCPHCGMAAEPEDVDSCGGFYEADYMSACIVEHLEPGDVVRLSGDAKNVFDESKLPEGVTLLED